MVQCHSKFEKDRTEKKLLTADSGASFFSSGLTRAGISWIFIHPVKIEEKEELV
jgi:hypothetical protein